MTIWQVLLLNAVAIAVVMIVLWGISLRLKDASIVDIFWGCGFVLVAWLTAFLTVIGPRSILLVALTTAWGLRLAGYLAWRNHGRGEDPRYAAMRDHHGDSFWWVSLLTVFSLQGAVMWLVSLPVQVGQFNSAPLSVWAYLGVLFWLVGFVFESVGDYQLARFKSSSDQSRKVMDQGLWRYTRHPNYFGNAMIWWGIFLVAVNANTLWLVISPILMTFLLLKVSGVALLERSLSERSEEYRQYIRRTSAFIPWPPKPSMPSNQTD
jgi:steroid 5-alpha reductase family enzyme